MKKHFLWALTGLLLFTGFKNVAEFEFQDNFNNGLATFWKLQKADDDRISVISDDKNSVLKVALLPTDRTHGGNRNELVIGQCDSLGYTTKYGFKFKLPESFFADESQNNWYMIHQWHDEPQPGYTWKTNKHKTKPPIALVIQYTVAHGYRLVYISGLQTGGLKEAKYTKWDQKLVPNTWYEFSNEVFWSLYAADGYSIPQINQQYMSPNKKVYGRNMYNIVGNYFKYGLYSSGRQKNNKTILFDDFTYTSYRTAYPLHKD